LDQETMKMGLLMEAAKRQQRLADSSLRKLKVHASELTGIVAEEVRRVLAGELQTLTSDSRAASDALRRLRRGVGWRLGLVSLSLSALSTALALAVAWWILPSRAELALLRARHDEYAASVAALERAGGRVDLRRCGDQQRLCVRVDRRAPAYGDSGEFLIVHGY
jgi:hypothetical protein